MVQRSAELGRFSEPSLLILISLASGPKHGYAVLDDIERLCGTRPGPGTLYGAIVRLAKLGTIQPIAAEDRRQPYRLTDAGAAALRSELAILRRITAAGLERMAAT